MENLIVAIALYIVIVAIAYCPNKTTATDPVAAPVQYFPEVEQITNSNPVVMPVQPAIAATSLSTITVATVQPDPIQSFTMPSAVLSALGVRDLYKLASQAGIKSYKKLSKPQLIAALA